mmetsp:Transcript_40569/g.49210  ORF Transcript_40569/g.49210 Transcript_40569/m.49210 type:complete len:85 (-) Transcript_40569:45-299(-)
MVAVLLASETNIFSGAALSGASTTGEGVSDGAAVGAGDDGDDSTDEGVGAVGAGGGQGDGGGEGCDGGGEGAVDSHKPVIVLHM